MPAYHIDRSIRIDAPATRVRPAVDDFAEWPKWSPWLCMEPTTNVNVFGKPGKPGHGYSWAGNLTGEGGMTIESSKPEVLEMNLDFLKPFKSNAQVKMEIKAVGEDQTDVTWHMDGKMPFFLFFMIGQMKTMIGMDYARGLKMLKEYVETGEVKSNTEIVGIVDVPTTKYVGVERECSMDQISESMGETMPQAIEAAANACPAGPPGAIYHRVDLKHGNLRYASIVPIKSSPNQVTASSDSVDGVIPACKAIKVIHRGSYANLGNAWSTIMAHQRYKKLKPQKKIGSFEFYQNDPATTAEEDLITELFLPIK